MWAAVGAMFVLGLDLIFLLPAAALLGIGAGTFRASWTSTSGFITGAGLPLLWVAYANRQGPGTVCWSTATASGCDQYLNPWPWLAAGLLLVVVGVATQSFIHRNS
ncbi:MAG TPA: hypothetical protein VE777_16290 [Gaiellales bacterium]|jgi:hypothetical protein|nr:hypothetical protein [Gaiellales bacterium]